jgi:asparagine synthetase B (glutamine-hydrolysing)
MFEIAITNNNNNSFACSQENKYGFSKALHESISFTAPKIKISGLRYKGENDDFYETEDFVIAVIGKVFFKLSIGSDHTNVSAQEVLNLFTSNNEAFIDKLKGNFIITIYNKKDDSVQVIKDQLGLKYLYYKSEKDNFYISTNLNDFKQVSKNINYAAVIEKLLFSYPIGLETYLEEVYMLEEGALLRTNNGRIKKDNNSIVDELFNTKQPLSKFDKKTFLDIFEISVLLRASVAPEINASLTGGFDGRTNIAVLLNHKKKFHSYSFGKEGGENTKVPLLVASKLKLDYEPIYLDGEFEQNYSQCALDVINFSDGISNFERANYIYAMHKLTEHARYNITGLIGGEIFAPVHLKTDYINDTYYDIIYTGSNFDINKLLLEKGLKEFINDEIINNKLIIEKVNNNIEARRKLVVEWKKEKYDWLYYLKDFITMGFHQFYGNQMHLERYYNENLSPFYDFDVMKYLFSTEHILVFQNAFKDSPLLRRQNRKLQTLIISHFSKAIAEIPVDRGYPPAYTTDIRRLLIPLIFYKRRFNRKRSDPEFDSPGWSKILYLYLIQNLDFLSSEFLDSQKTILALKKYNSEKYNKSFNQLLSIAIWLKQ